MTRKVPNERLWLYRIELPQRRKVVKQVKCLLGEKEAQYVWTDHEVGRVAELRPCGCLNDFYGAFFPCFLWPTILICLGHRSYLVYLRIFRCVHMHLLAKMDFTKKASGNTIPYHCSLFGLQGTFSEHVWSGKFLDFRTKKDVVWAGPSLLVLIVLLFLSWSFCP